MHIGKLASDRERFRRPFHLYANARTAFKTWLQALDLGPDEAVLLPAFIGWSAREGSGVFDPVAELKLSCHFYQISARLEIDLDDLRRLLRDGKVGALVLIHYFGYVDPGYAEAVRLAREHGVPVLEDEAHAMLTDLVGGISGRLGDAAIYSLHKLLPEPHGGMLVLNPGSSLRIRRPASGGEGLPLPWEYDLHQIARSREGNAGLLAELLEPHGDLVEPLRKSLLPGEVPQTFPVVIHRGSRDTLYQTMNDAGYGVVTLYHTMIDRITPEHFPESHRLARKILNLPVHQDAAPESLEGLVAKLVESIRSMRDDR